MVEKTYIEREPVIQFIEHGLNEKNFGYDAIEILGEIQFAPASDVMPVKHGHWRKEDLGIVAIWRCSNCRSMYDFYLAKPAYKYCPNCGACMDGGDKNED